jgi:hypothetical protein
LKYLVVTSWSPFGEALYGRRFIESFSRYWQPNATLCVVTDELLGDDARFVQFMEKHSARRMHPSDAGYDYRQDLLRFSHKVFALTGIGLDEAKKGDYDYVIWLDGDVETMGFVDDALLAMLCPEDADGAYLSRRDTWNHSECGFMSFNLRKRGFQFLTRFRQEYVSGKVLLHAELHDSYVFDRVRERHDYKFVDLAPRGAGPHGLDAFEASILHPTFKHRKGGRKNELMSEVAAVTTVSGPSQAATGTNLTPSGTLSPTRPVRNRYDQLQVLVEAAVTPNEPFRMLEIGTWTGERAMQLALVARKAGASVVWYYGYDLFDSATADDDKRELNVKPHMSFEDVKKRLDDFKDRNEWFVYNITAGDTRQTLGGDLSYDFAFIDGGHSIETIKSDFEGVKGRAAVIVLDDFYSADEHGKAPDITKYGVNQALRNERLVLLPSADRVKDGGVVHLVIAANDDYLKRLPKWLFEPLPDSPQELMAKKMGFRSNLALQVRNSRVDKELQGNIRTNQRLFPRWLRLCRPHYAKAAVVGGGPSLLQPDVQEELKAEYARGTTIVCVKHSYQLLRSLGITPHVCVLLDPRAHSGPSTHGESREAMLAEVAPETRFFVASQVDPSVVRLLLTKTANVYGWHAAVGAGEDKLVKKDEVLVMGGTTSAMRALNILFLLGFRNFALYGLDSSVTEEHVKKHQRKDDSGADFYYTMEVSLTDERSKQKVHARTFYTCHDLYAQAQDFVRIMKENPYLNMEVRGDSMLRHIWDTQFGMRVAGLPDFADAYGMDEVA